MVAETLKSSKIAEELTPEQTDKVQTLLKIFPKFGEDKIKWIVQKNSGLELLELSESIHKMI